MNAATLALAVLGAEAGVGAQPASEVAMALHLKNLGLNLGEPLTVDVVLKNDTLTTLKLPFSPTGDLGGSSTRFVVLVGPQGRPQACGELSYSITADFPFRIEDEAIATPAGGTITTHLELMLPKAVSGAAGRYEVEAIYKAPGLIPAQIQIAGQPPMYACQGCWKGEVSSEPGTVTLSDPEGVDRKAYDADMRDMELPYGDAYVELGGLRSGTGAVPFVHWNTDAAPSSLVNFSTVWWSSGNRGLPNRLHLLGVEGAKPSSPSTVGGSPYLALGGPQSGVSYVFVGRIEQNHPTDPPAQHAVGEYCAVHELGHQFAVLALTDNTYHCSQLAWIPPSGSQWCFMNSPFITYLGYSPRLCVPHLFSGGNDLVDVHTSIRDQQDPLPY